MAYIAAVRPVLEYATTVWDSIPRTTPERSQEDLEMCSRNCNKQLWLWREFNDRYTKLLGMKDTTAKNN